MAYRELAPVEASPAPTPLTWRQWLCWWRTGHDWQVIRTLTLPTVIYESTVCTRCGREGLVRHG